MSYKDADGITHYTSEELLKRDLEETCPECNALLGAMCIGLDTQRHFGRRLLWLVNDHRPDLMPAEYKRS